MIAGPYVVALMRRIKTAETYGFDPDQAGASAWYDVAMLALRRSSWQKRETIANQLFATARAIPQIDGSYEVRYQLKRSIVVLVGSFTECLAFIGPATIQGNLYLKRRSIS